ncbi:hypothetical protein EB796_020283 [Bugula neritina]|uniref:EGF-like domain-containing protein n=1 Tax=Bugula neritina TaxID=10212 RepID=A0A7J7J6X8_BUGNE|nr:hypothetical protein EB796_020283 [Bugula neritina]
MTSLFLALGWTDNSTCNVDINECDLDICENGGNCTNTNGSFTCQCTEFWTGDVCSEDILECSQPDSCQNSGNCTELEGGFTCNCTGTDLCENSGLCVDTIGSYACNCSKTRGGLKKLETTKTDLCAAVEPLITAVDYASSGQVEHHIVLMN